MYEYTKNELSCRYLKWNPKSINETRTFIENTLEDYQNKKNFLWGIEQKQIKKLIGVIRMYSIDIDNSSAEISYIINPSFCRQGYATEAIKGIIQYAFQSMNLNRIQALCVVENAASKQAILNAGMSLEGILRSYVCIKGHYKDMYIYSIIKEPSIISTLL